MLTTTVRTLIRRHPAQAMRSFASTSSASDLNYAIQMVRSHDPVGYVPGQLLPDKDMKETYYGVRSFWVETGLRFGTTAMVPPYSTPDVHLEWWREGINHVYSENNLPSDWKHPTLHFLQDLVKRHDLSKEHFDDIIHGRDKDLDMKQYKTLADLSDHARMSCGSLFSLVLESGNITEQNNPAAHDAARLVGIAHGITNALRLSIPLVSTTGKLIVPEDLCLVHNVRSPRYLLSALGQGDTECKRSLQEAVSDIAKKARSHLQEARELSSAMLLEEHGAKAVSVLIPGVASEVFLDRLATKGYDLTDKNLRNVGFMEQTVCVGKMVAAYYGKTY